jgi:ATP-binding cassette subfamily B protein
MGISASKEELDRACDISGCTEFIRKLPAGYDSFLDETGGGLSGGEKQRLILARAIVRDPDFLIMDEATSNMDYVTEKTTFNLMFKKLANRPMLIIAHRLSTIRNCDRIYMMDAGKVVESGTHDELIALHGAYYHLWSSQTGEGQDEEGADEETADTVKKTEEALPVEEGDIVYE